MRHFVFGILIGVLALSASALNIVSTEPINAGSVVTFQSSILEETRRMHVFLPESFHEASEDHVYPVIFINGSHGERFFLTLSGLVQHMSHVNRMPESIVVSLHGERYHSPNVYTNGMWGRETISSNGDPDKFARHLREEVFPYLREHYRAADYRMIVGVSGSSIYPLHTFAKQPDLFQAHVFMAAADMVGMGYEPGKSFIDAFEESLAASPDRRAQLYVSVAENDLTYREEGDSERAKARNARRASYRQNLDELESRLARFSNLRLRVEIVPQEGHYDSFIKAMLSALEMIYPQAKWTPKFRDMVAQPGDALANIDAYHQKLSEEYGFAILPRANRWNSVNCLRYIGGMLVRDERVEEAVSVMARWAQYRPRSVAALRGLSQALEADGQLGAAISHQERLIELARQQEDSRLADDEKRLGELRGKLAETEKVSASD